MEVLKKVTKRARSEFWSALTMTSFLISAADVACCCLHYPTVGHFEEEANWTEPRTSPNCLPVAVEEERGRKVSTKVMVLGCLFICYHLKLTFNACTGAL